MTGLLVSVEPSARFFAVVSPTGNLQANKFLLRRRNEDGSQTLANLVNAIQTASGVLCESRRQGLADGSVARRVERTLTFSRFFLFSQTPPWRFLPSTSWMEELLEETSDLVSARSTISHPTEATETRN
jgi:hypothetical protein